MYEYISGVYETQDCRTPTLVIAYNCLVQPCMCHSCLLALCMNICSYCFYQFPLSQGEQGAVGDRGNKGYQGANGKRGQPGRNGVCNLDTNAVFSIYRKLINYIKIILIYSCLFYITRSIMCLSLGKLVLPPIQEVLRGMGP